MKLLKLFENITLSQALEVFDLKEVPEDKTILKRIYTDLSKKNHPDRGGSHEKMILITQAYELLKKSNATTTYFKPIDREAEKKRAEEIVNTMKEMFERTFSPEKILAYLSQFTLEDLDIEVSNYDKASYYAEYSSIVVEVEVFNPDRSLMFYLSYYISYNDISSGLGNDTLDADEIMYDYNITSYVLYNNRKQKLQQKNWRWQIGKEKAFDYSDIFPASKLEKLFSTGGKKSFRKADFQTLLLKKGNIDAHINKDIWFLYPFDSKRVYINLSRLTFRRVPRYMITGMWIINEKGKNEFKRFSKTISFGETEEDCLRLIEVIYEARKYMDKKKLSIKEDSIEIANYIDDLLIYAFNRS